MATNGSRTTDVGTQVREGARQLEERLGEQLGNVREYAQGLDGWVRDLARERPLVAVGCAVGLGFLLGRLASRI